MSHQPIHKKFPPNQDWMYSYRRPQFICNCIDNINTKQLLPKSCQLTRSFKYAHAHTLVHIHTPIGINSVDDQSTTTTAKTCVHSKNVLSNCSIVGCCACIWICTRWRFAPLLVQNHTHNSPLPESANTFSSCVLACWIHRSVNKNVNFEWCVWQKQKQQ